MNTQNDTGTIPEHKIESPLVGDIAIDQQAKLVDPLPYKDIFLCGMAAGSFDSCLNPAQVNKAISAVKGNGKTCVYMVSEIAHRWERVNGKWTDRGDAWVKANPFTPAVRGERESVKGRLSDVDYAALVGQQTALKTLTGDLAVSVAPLLKEITERVSAHDAAVALEAVNQVSIRRRKAIMGNIETVLRDNDKAGGKYPLTLTVNEAGEVVVG